MLLSFFTPFVVIVNSIPKCVMGGACVALYGFIAVSGLQMLKNVDLGNNKNLFVVSSILVCGIGGLTLEIGKNPVTGGPLLSITSLAVSLIIGIITNLVVNNGKLEDEDGSILFPIYTDDDEIEKLNDEEECKQKASRGKEQ